MQGLFDPDGTAESVAQAWQRDRQHDHQNDRRKQQCGVAVAMPQSAPGGAPRDFGRRGQVLQPPEPHLHMTIGGTVQPLRPNLAPLAGRLQNPPRPQPQFAHMLRPDQHSKPIDRSFVQFDWNLRTGETQRGRRLLNRHGATKEALLRSMFILPMSLRRGSITITHDDISMRAKGLSSVSSGQMYEKKLAMVHPACSKTPSMRRRIETVLLSKRETS